MVQIIQENRRPNLGQQFGQAFSNAAGSLSESYVNHLMEKQNKEEFKKENDFIKNLTGQDISGIKDPKIRQKFVEMALESENQSKKFKDQYDAKYGAQFDMMKKLGLDFEGNDQQNNSDMPQERFNSGIDNVELNEEERPSREKPKLIPENKIAAMSLINPAVADKWQKHNE